MEETAVHSEAPENETDASGGYREPHPEESAEAASEEEISHSSAEPAAEISRAPETGRERRPERRPEPARPKPWVKPADFRPAEISAVSQAVAHATEIAESLKHTIDQLDEILELVELAERQKIADEREIDELRRALRRIQPPRHQPQPPRGPRRDEPRHGRHESRENIPRHDEPSRPPEAEEPPAPAD